MITDCAQGYQIAMAYPEAQIVSSSCKGCPHMKRITLRNIYDALMKEQHEVVISEEVLEGARVPLEKMNALMKEAAKRKAKASPEIAA